MKKWIDWLSRHTFITTCTIALLLCVLVTIGYGAYNKIAYVRLLSQPITSKSGQHQSCITVAKFTNLAFETALRKAINRTEGILFREELEMVNDLAMVDSAELDDITDIAMLPNLENLAIINCSVQDITPLASLDKLVNVHLCQNKIEDITPLSRLQFVEVLDLSSNQISTLPPDMNGLKNLNLLVLDDNGLENLDHIEEIPVLEKLQVRHNHIEKLKILGPIPNLASLDVSNNPIIFMKIDCLTNLQELNISYTNISSLDFLDKNMMLEKLDISWTDITDISRLSNCEALEMITLYGFKTMDLKPLELLPGFNSIYLDQDFDRTSIDFMIGNYKIADLKTRVYLTGKKNNLLD